MQTRWSFSSGDSDASRSLVVVALRPYEARAITGLQDRATAIFRRVLAAQGELEADAAGIVEKNFADHDSALENRLMVAFYGREGAALTPETEVVGFSRVYETKQWGHGITCTSLAAQLTLNDEQAYSVAHALFQATQEMGTCFAEAALRSQSVPGGMIEFWRSRYGVTARVEALFEQHGFSTSKVERLEMTKFFSSEEALPEFPTPEGIEVKRFDPESDDLNAVYAVWELAYDDDPHPPCSTWERFYVKAPRFAPELSFVAWDGEKPVGGVFLEYVVDGEGGGDAGVWEFMALVNQPLKKDTLAHKYEERKHTIRRLATEAYVCAAGTLKEYRGRHLARTLLAKALAGAQKHGLDKVYLGTDRTNAAAVKAYTAAGMVETKRTAQGTMTVAEIRLSP